MPAEQSSFVLSHSILACIFLEIIYIKNDTNVYIMVLSLFPKAQNIKTSIFQLNLLLVILKQSVFRYLNHFYL